MTTTLLIVAHPDDEILAAGALIARLDDVTVAHVTDGAPRDRRFWPVGLDLDRIGYAALRRAEAAAALERAGVPPGRIVGLGAVDQEAALELPRLVARVIALVEAVAPDVLITHAYEGGHPDHDASAFAVQAVVRVLGREGRRSPRLLEAACYHGAGGFAPGRFLAAPGSPEVRFALSPAEADRKRAMLACHASQSAVIAAFPVGDERVRAAPRHDFARPPHPGARWYEQLGFPARAEDLCARFAACARALDL
jgi:LmbE family N-acetylglucosaminyl deacetylase